MGKINHRRFNKERPANRYSEDSYRHGNYAKAESKGGYLRKGGWGTSKESKLADRRVGANASYDWSKGNRGMAKDVRGAKKYVNSRFRFHENQATKKLIREGSAEE